MPFAIHAIRTQGAPPLHLSPGGHHGGSLGRSARGMAATRTGVAQERAGRLWV